MASLNHRQLARWGCHLYTTHVQTLAPLVARYPPVVTQRRQHLLSLVAKHSGSKMHFPPRTNDLFYFPSKTNEQTYQPTAIWRRIMNRQVAPIQKIAVTEARTKFGQSQIQPPFQNLASGWKQPSPDNNFSTQTCLMSAMI